VPRPRHLLAVLLAALAAPAVASAFTVYGAASLASAFPAIDAAPAYQFLGSDVLATQITSGAPADVFASASPRYSQSLAAAGLCGKPVTFATNVLVLITPAGNPAGVRSVYDLNRGTGKTLAVGQPKVPIGSYTRTLLRRLGLSAVLTRNTVSSEPNVASIVAKVALGSADAGFVYYTDYRAAADRLGHLRLPRWAQPPVRYEICAVRRTGADTAAAGRFIRKVLGPSGRAVLKRAGFGLPRLR
jgi:molybdate transport system substrate-binding protein